jgi:hypothetical protein
MSNNFLKSVKKNHQAQRQQAQMGMPQLTEADTIERQCPCGGKLFDLAYRVRIWPSVSPKNQSGRDLTIKIEAFVCRDCGLELGQQPIVKPEDLL